MREDDDDLFPALAGLAPVRPDPVRESRLRQRYHRELARRRQRLMAGRLVDVAAASSLCAYLAAMAAAAMRLLLHA